MDSKAVSTSAHTAAGRAAMPSPGASARDREEQLLDRCVAAANGQLDCAVDEREANIFLLASVVLPSGFREQAVRLARAAQAFLGSAEPLDPGEVVRRGWVVSLPRLRQGVQDRIEGRA